MQVGRSNARHCGPARNTLSRYDTLQHAGAGSPCASCHATASTMHLQRTGSAPRVPVTLRWETRPAQPFRLCVVSHSSRRLLRATCTLRGTTEAWARWARCRGTMDQQSAHAALHEGGVRMPLLQLDPTSIAYACHFRCRTPRTRNTYTVFCDF